VTRAAFIALALGVVGLVVTALSGGSGHGAMPSYLAAWLFWSALPIGALPVLMTLDLLGRGEGAAAFVRPLLLAWPAVLVLAVPLLLGVGATYPWAASTAEAVGFAKIWFVPGLFVVRACVYLAIWLVLALLFAGPRQLGERPGRAAVGLMLHVVVGTFAAIDWSMSMDAHWHSSTYGLLFVTTQIATAAAAGVLIAAGSGLLGTIVRAGGAMLLLPAAIWGYLSFVQFLIVWSGDLPDEIGTYISRSSGAGQVAEWFLLAAGLLLPVLAAVSGRVRLLAAGAALVVVAHLVEMFWLVTPAVRGSLTLSLADVAATIGIGGIVVGSALLLTRRSPAWQALEVRHV